MQLEAIASRPITSYLGEETDACLTTTSFQVVVESCPWMYLLYQREESEKSAGFLLRLVNTLT